MLLEWQTIAVNESHDITQRLKVPGGWCLVRIQGIKLPHTMTSWFVPDPNHEWHCEIY